MFNPKTRILVVDDFATMRKIVKKCLKEMGYENVQEADDGQTALPLIKSGIEKNEPFEVIVSDWNMPGMTGLELLKHVRSDAKTKGLPFLMVTAEAEQKQIIEAVKAGVSDYVVKPFNTPTLKLKFENIYKKTHKAAA